MIDKIMSPEEQEKFAARIWEESQSGIKKNVEYAIQSELQHHMASITRRMVARELDAILRPLIEEKKEELKVKAQTVADRLLTRMEAAVHKAMEESIQDTVQVVARNVSEVFIRRLTIAVHGALKQETTS